uniref:Metalloendopeptidase n=1 Tax=Biomphalaria glabrata TaxID=6526 RepID=A0A2C9KBX8_BIOGL
MDSQHQLHHLRSTHAQIMTLTIYITSFFKIYLSAPFIPLASAQSYTNDQFENTKNTHLLNNSLKILTFGLKNELFSHRLNHLKEIHYLNKVLTEELALLNSICQEKTCTNTVSNMSLEVQRKLNLYTTSIQNYLEQVDYLKERKVNNLRDWKKSHDKVRHKRAATALKERLWDYGVIPYVIESRFTPRQKNMMRSAMETWEKDTCIIFKEKEPEDKDYIVFTVRACGCCSYVGKKGDGEQTVSIGKYCDRHGIIVHELGHAIGFWHEHTRPDRDQYVEIFLDNVIANSKNNFNALNSSEINSLGEPYDFESIMHYGRLQFAKNTFQDTLRARRLPGMTFSADSIGQRVKLSPGDIRQTKLLYNCPSCGSTLVATTGSFNFSSKLGQPEVCQWRIKAAYGERIKLNITSFSITVSDNCERNYLEIRDGHYVKSPSLGRYCGNNVPDVILSSGRRMWIEFKSNGGLDEFSAEYITLCGGDIKKDEHFINSQGYPNERYLPNSYCVWNITVKENFFVNIKFETLDLEASDDTDCKYDYLEVRNGHGDLAVPIGRYCGDDHPEEIVSSGNKVSLVFVSDSEIQKFGFSVHYIAETDECETDEHGCDHVCINTIGSFRCDCRIGYELHSNGKTCKKECGGQITEMKGNITSPSFPDNYPVSKVCTWYITAPKDNKIILIFTHFDIEGNEDRCYFDYVSVNLIGDNDPRKTQYFCGNNLPKPLLSKGNSMKIEFKSDAFDVKSGFVALFSIDRNECEERNGGCIHICKNTIGSYQCFCRDGYILQSDQHSCVAGCHRIISSSKGNITSPNFPNPYPRRLECEWHFSTILGHRIMLSFKEFDVEPHLECDYDNVVVFDGDSKNSATLGKYCGSTFPEQIISSGTTMLLQFNTDNSGQRKGFRAEHETICGAILEATFEKQTLLSHPEFSKQNYGFWQDCPWLFEAPDGFKVELEFDYFHLEASGECQYDSVAVYDGDSDTAPSLGVFCGKSVPPKIMSSKNVLFLHFLTDNTVSRKGFQLNFRCIARVSKKTDYVD